MELEMVLLLRDARDNPLHHYLLVGWILPLRVKNQNESQQMGPSGNYHGLLDWYDSWIHPWIHLLSRSLRMLVQ